MIFDMVNGALDAARYSRLSSIADETDRIETRVAVEAFANCPDFKFENTRMKQVPAQEVLNMLNRHGGIAMAMEAEVAPQDEVHHLRRVFDAINEKHARIGGGLDHDSFKAMEADLQAMEAEMAGLHAMAEGEDPEEFDYFSDRSAAQEAVESFIGIRNTFGAPSEFKASSYFG